MKPVTQILGLALAMVFAAGCSEDGTYTKGTPKVQQPLEATDNGPAIADGAELTANRVLSLGFDQYVYGLSSDGLINMGGDFCRIQISNLGGSAQYRVEKNMKFKFKAHTDTANAVQFFLEETGGSNQKLLATCYERNKLSGAIGYIERSKLTNARLGKILGLQ